MCRDCDCVGHVVFPPSQRRNGPKHIWAEQHRKRPPHIILLRSHRWRAEFAAPAGWLDRLQRRNRAVGVVIAVTYKYLDDQGGYLSALITYYGFVSLFPLLLLLTTGLGVVLTGRPNLQHEVLQSTLSQFPVIGSQLHQPGGLSGGTAAVVVGVVGALYGGLGVGQTVQNAMDSVWAVPRNKRPNLIRSRVRSLLLLFVRAPPTASSRWCWVCWRSSS